MVTATESQLRWIRDWGGQLGGAVWIRGPAGRLVYVNARAERLLHAAAGELVGRPCCDAVASKSTELQSYCAPTCPVLRLARTRSEIPPVDLCIQPAGSAPQWIRLMAFAFGGTPEQDPYVVECSLCMESERAILDFMHRVAARSRLALAGAAAAPFQSPCHEVHELSPRERQILGLLTADQSHDRIAAQLRVRPVTVRNHIQHLLAKLGVHSILEAVALNLLHERDLMRAGLPPPATSGPAARVQPAPVPAPRRVEPETR